MALDASRRAALHEQRARALVGIGAEHAAYPLPGAVAFATDELATVLIHEAGPKPLGAVLVWAWSRGIGSLRLLVDESAEPGTVARRGGVLGAASSVEVVDGDGTTRPAVPTPLPQIAPPVVDDALRAELATHGVDLVADHDGLRLEVLGLEVGRVDPSATGDAPFSVGVGAVDREATRVLHGGTDPWDNLVRVADEVRRHRQAGDRRHPLSFMARERWMVRWLTTCPEQVGATAVIPVIDPLPHPGMRTEGPAGAMAEGATDGARLVLTAVGGDAGMLSVFADHVVGAGPDEVLLVIPEGHGVPAVHDAIGTFAVPTTSCTLPAPWA